MESRLESKNKKLVYLRRKIYLKYLKKDSQGNNMTR